MFHRYKKQNDKKLIHKTTETDIHRHLSDATRVLPNQPYEKQKDTNLSKQTSYETKRTPDGTRHNSSTCFRSLVS